MTFEAQRNLYLMQKYAPEKCLQIIMLLGKVFHEIFLIAE